MKQIPISRFLNMSLEDFLQKVGAVQGNSSYPSQVYLSDEDAATLKRAQRRKFRAEKPYLRKRYIDVANETYWLQYGPNTTLGKAVRPGYALIDVDSIPKTPEVYSYKVTAVCIPTRMERIKAFLRKCFAFRG